MAEKIPLRNPEGYPDPTAHDALTNVMRERSQQLEAADQRMSRLIKVLKGAIDLAGFELMARIEIKDKSTGRMYR